MTYVPWNGNHVVLNVIHVRWNVNHVVLNVIRIRWSMNHTLLNVIHVPWNVYALLNDHAPWNMTHELMTAFYCALAFPYIPNHKLLSGVGRCNIMSNALLKD